MFSMSQKPWTPAAELSVRGMQNASQSYGSMDKEVKIKKSKSNIFGDILPVVGMVAGAALGGPMGLTAAQGAMIGSGVGGMAGAAVGGRNAAQLGALGAKGADMYHSMSSAEKPDTGPSGNGETAGHGSAVPSVDESLASLTKNPWAIGFTGRGW